MSSPLLSALHRYWGYSSFRPLQEQVVNSLLTGRDACVVMPTGGGKSLCYQLPAAMSEGRTAIVVSPLIALMQDQVAQLEEMGISAALLNSSQTAAEQSAILRNAEIGKYRLLYLSPERLARPDALNWLCNIPISFLVIDEAHCISEWGHEFRPEYRQLHSLRARFPDCPIAAFTASATQQVRHDIVEQLQLRDVDKYIASFQRPNLYYHVRQCDARSQRGLLLRAVEQHDGSNIIVYAPTITRVEETVAFLAHSGITAVGYHAKMDNATRRKNQERWMSDEVRVLVGTIAFGLGINKAAVRAVIHLSLPKSIEQYYQEAGRGGRDGQPADCLLLWQKRDVGLLTYFVEQLTDPAEKARAWQRYHIVRNFVESNSCRHRRICVHFGETPKWSECNACDVCIGAPGWLGAPAVTKKKSIESKVISGKAGVTGRSAPVDANGELREHLRLWRLGKSRELGVSAFTIMQDTTLDELCRIHPSTLAELRRVPGCGDRKTQLYGAQILEAFKNFGLKPRGVAPASEQMSTRDDGLREHLREWRRDISRALSIPAFIVMHDTTLDELCRVRPSTLAQLRTVSGFGDRKVEMYGRQILEALKSFDTKRMELASAAGQSE